MIKKVLIIGYFDYAYMPASAIYVSHLRDILLGNGYEVVILDKNRREYKQQEADVIPINTIANEMEDYFGYSKIEKYVSTDFYAILLYNFSAYETLRILIRCKRLGIRVGAISTEWKEWKDKKPIKALVKGIDIFVRMRILNKKADINICCSHYFVDYYRRYNPIYLPTLTGPAKTIPAQKNAYLRLIYIGIPSRHKEDLKTFIEALISSNLLDKCRFDLFGLSSSEYNKIFGAKFSENQYSNICFHGRVSQDQIQKILPKYDYSIIFRRRNRVNMAGFPTKLGTSLVNGVPVLATDVGDIRYYVKDGYNGYILPTDISCLKSFLNDLPNKQKPKVDQEALYWKRFSVSGNWSL